MDPAALRELLISWANINSGSDHLPGLARMRAALRQEFSTFRHATVEECTLSGTSALALRVRCRPSAPIQILLSGHYDTVYGANHPFQNCTLIDAHTLRGPGVADMKGGIVVLLAALRTFEASAHASRIGWEIILGPDEEIGSAGTAPLLAEAATRAQLGLVFEPARENGNVVKSRKGTGIFRLTCHGRAAHAGRDPSSGRNAILALAELLPQVDALNHQLPGIMVNVGHIRGGGAVNIVPDFAEAEVNFRIARASDETFIRQRLRDLAAPINARDGFRLEISGRFNRPPKETTASEETLFAAWQQCGRELNVPFGWQDVAGGSDGNLLSAAGLSNLDGLGVVGGRLHSPDEYVNLPSLEQRARIAACFLEKLAAGEVSLPTRSFAHNSQ